MIIDLSVFPTTFDTLHLILSVSSALFLVLFLTKKSAPSEPPKKVQSEQQPSSLDSDDADVIKETAPSTPQVLKEVTPEAALQLLSLLQQEARFIDFTQEDLTGFSDAQIGAAARIVHEGSKKTLNAYFTLEPIRKEQEESRVSIQQGFNASEIRLTGNVIGKAPFNGTLVHKGWKASQVMLPKLTKDHDPSIIAAAEVEL